MRHVLKELDEAIGAGNKFYVFLTGRGDGCDYTVGCNMTLRPLKANNYEEALTEIPEIIDEYEEIGNAVIFETSKVFIFDVNALYQEIEDKLEEEDHRIEEESERADYERLKAKFGD